MDRKDIEKMDRKDIEKMIGRELTYKEMIALEIGQDLYERSENIIYKSFDPEFSNKIFDAIKDDQLFI
jgi:hypothetical protein